MAKSREAARAAWRAVSCVAAFAALVSGGAAGAVLEGTATYRERIALPPGAVFEAQLQDVSRADAPATVLGRAKLEPAGQPPFRFAIAYDESAVVAGRRYTVRATVSQDGRLLFTTDRTYPVLDGRNAPLDLLLVAVKRPPPAAKADDLGRLPASFEGEIAGPGGPVAWHVDLAPEGRFQLRTTNVGRPEPNRFDDIGRWTREAGTGRIVLRGGREAPVFLMPVDGGSALRKLGLSGEPLAPARDDRLARLPAPVPIEPRLFLTGMFVYMADAANIVLCADGRSLPVAMEADFRALEAAYLAKRPGPGQRLLVSVEGLIAARPSMEAARPPLPTLVVERFVGAWPGQRCGAAVAGAPR